MSTAASAIDRPRGAAIGVAASRIALAVALAVLLALWGVPGAYVLALAALAALAALGGTLAASHARLVAVQTDLQRALDERRLFAAVADASSDVIEIAGADRRPRYLNPTGRRLAGIAPDAALAEQALGALDPPERRGAANTALALDAEQRETELRNSTTGAAIPVAQLRFVIRDPRTGVALGSASIARDLSETKQLEQSLRDVSADFIRAQSVAGVGSWRYDATRESRNWSPEVFHILGLPPDTVPSRQVFVDALHPDDRPLFHRAWAAALDGLPYDIELRVVAGGAVRWVRAKADFRFDEHGALAVGIGTLQDINDRRRLEDELRTAEARASGIVSISADAIVSIDEQQRITLFNEGASRIFGYSKDEVIGQPIEILLPERFRARHRRYIEEFATGVQIARRMGERGLSIFGRRKNGEEFAADASISKLEVGGQRTLTASLRDVSEQKRTDTEHQLLAELSEVLSSSLDYEPTLSNLAAIVARELADFCLVHIVDPGGEVTQIKAVCRDPARTWVCECLMRIRPVLGHPHVAAETIATGRPVLYDVVTPARIRAFAQDDEHFQALRALDARSILVVPLVARSSFLGAIALVATRSSRVYDLKDLRFAEDIAHRAALSIDNARLYQLARRAVRSRDEVLGVVAHDLRNPLNSISLYAEMLARDEAEMTKKAVAAIERATTRMNRLIEDLLDVTRIEGGALALERKSCNPQQLVYDAADSQRTLASAAGLELRVEVSGDLPMVWADRDRMAQILENLLSNAIKFTDHGTVVVGATARARDVMFWISDTGSGIALADQRHVFDRFWQGKYRRRGAGLGLPIAKGLIEAHGGRIWLESTPGRGTTFFFTVPVGTPLPAVPLVS